jgi:hypothetical protein
MSSHISLLFSSLHGSISMDDVLVGLLFVCMVRSYPISGKLSSSSHRGER